MSQSPEPSGLSPGHGLPDPPPADGPAWYDSAPGPAPGDRRAAVLAGLAVGLAVLALGVPLGLLWSVVAPDVPIRVTEAGPIYGEPQPEQLIAADGWFALLSIPFGVLVAVGAWTAVRSIRGAPGLLAATAGAVFAGFVAWWLGRQVGLSGYQATLAAAEAGAELGRPADLRVMAAGWWPPRLLGVLLVPAFVCATTYTLLAAWSQLPSLREERLAGQPEGVPPRFHDVGGP